MTSIHLTCFHLIALRVIHVSHNRDLPPCVQMYHKIRHIKREAASGLRSVTMYNTSRNCGHGVARTAVGKNPFYGHKCLEFLIRYYPMLTIISWYLDPASILRIQREYVVRFTPDSALSSKPRESNACCSMKMTKNRPCKPISRLSRKSWL